MNMISRQSRIRMNSSLSSSSSKLFLLLLAICNVVAKSNPNPQLIAEDIKLRQNLFQRDLKENNDEKGKGKQTRNTRPRKKQKALSLFEIAELLSAKAAEESAPSYMPSLLPSESSSNMPSTSSTTASPTVKQQEGRSGTTSLPTLLQSVEPTLSPTALPSLQPTMSPTVVPTLLPSFAPTFAPTSTPSAGPSSKPTARPTLSPTGSPLSTSSEKPSFNPSTKPTSTPSESTSVLSTLSTSPSVKLTTSMSPSSSPTVAPSASLSSSPTDQPSTSPTESPSDKPSTLSSKKPSSSPNESLSAQPSSPLSESPSAHPSSDPSSTPSRTGSISPTTSPIPTAVPSFSLSPTTSQAPTTLPSSNPTISMMPSITPSASPTIVPSLSPSTLPSVEPSVNGSAAPSESSVPTGVPSTAPSSIPSLTPSAVPSISQQPSLSTPSWCKDDSEATFFVEFNGGTSRKKNCDWLATLRDEVKQLDRCKIVEVKEACPVTCKDCFCRDNEDDFEMITGEKKDCDWVGQDLSRCSTYKEARYNCPSICGRCPPAYPSMSPTATFFPSGSPSEEPSISTRPSTIRPLVDVKATIQLQLGPVDGSTMSELNKKLFQDTINAWLKTTDRMKPKLVSVETKITNQIVRKLNRRKRSLRRNLLDSGDYVLFFDLIVNAQFQPIGAVGQPGSITNAEEANLQVTISTLFSDPNTNDTLIVALTNNTSSAADYFIDMLEVTYSRNDPNSIGIPVENDGDEDLSFWTNNRILILAGAIGAAAILVLIVSLFVFGKSRRSRMNQSNTAEGLDDANFLATPNSQNNQEKIRQSWEDVQPTQPYPQNTDFGIDVDDEGTDGGRTFNTLEKIYSGEGGDQMSFQSYGYSLDDGIMSKQSDTESLKGKEKDKKKGSGKLLGEIKPNFESDDLDFSLASPGGVSVYSGLTNEDASLRQILKDVNIKQENQNDEDDEESDEEDPLESSEEKQYKRVFLAPPGKLGVVIDTTKLGPVVYQVKDDSPLKSVIFPGDRIIAVDDIDTTGMTASNITKIMASKSEMERRITVSSEKKDNNDDSVDV